jgi:asparagine synthase (glutamine-hydrolysing)
MCGIAGFAGTGDRGDLAAMTMALAHRGPDGEGSHVDEAARVFLGHRRLAILDLEGGSQPMWNEDGTVAVIFNGEIYNHLELRLELQARGHVFASDHSDTEVLVHGYEEWGDGLPIRLNGMFAFAIWDVRRGRLFLARDRFGEKPLYYAARPGCFAFASELSALIRHPAVGTELDLRALQKFFAYGYLPGANALYAGTNKLPPGHHLTLDLADGVPRLGCYWRFRIEPDAALGDRSEASLVEELRALLSAAVGRRLISDVPLGLFLSGGLDSSSVLWAAAQHRPAASIESFTIGFTEPSFDESDHAWRVARHFGTQHREKMLDLDTARDLVPALLGRLDEPLGDASLLPTWLLSAFTRRACDGRAVGRWRRRALRRLRPVQGAHPGALLCPADATRPASRVAAPGRPAAGLDRQHVAGFQAEARPRRPLLSAFRLEPGLDGAARAGADGGDLRGTAGAGGALQRGDRALGGGRRSRPSRPDAGILHQPLSDRRHPGQDGPRCHDGLARSRAVFLDNDLVEFCRRLPHRWKFRNGTRKYLLKQAMAGLLPPEIVHRRKKGFGIPAAKWLRSIPPVPPLPADRRHPTAMPSPNAGVRHRAGAIDDRLFLWSWLSFAALQS